MSWLDVLQNMTKNVGRGALDVFSLGGNELGHQFGGQGYQKFMSPVETGMGANLEAGAAGGSGIMGAQGLGMGGGAGMTPYAPSSAPNMASAGSTLGPGGMASPLNPMSAGAPASAGSSGNILKALQMMRGGGGQGQAQGQPQGPEDVMQKLYAMFPELRPGSQLGQKMNMGGSGGY